MRKFLKPTKVSALLAVMLAGALVLAGCDNGGGGSTVAQAPAAPVINPASLDVPVLGQLYFEWAAVAGAISYDVQWRLVGGSWSDLVMTTDITDLYYTVTGLTVAESYQVRVRAIGAGGAGA